MWSDEVRTFFELLKSQDPMLSSCSQSLLFKVFSHIMTRRMHMLVFIFSGIKTGFLTPLLCFQLSMSLPFYSQKVYCFSMTFLEPHFNFMTSRPGKCNNKIPQLSRFSKPVRIKSNPFESEKQTEVIVQRFCKLFLLIRWPTRMCTGDL